MNFQQNTETIRRLAASGPVVLLLILCLLSSPALSIPANPDPLQAGFDDMYNLSFAEAHRAFQNWEHDHPSDPRGPVFDAAAYLFSEFDRLRILQSEFFVDDRNFENRRQLAADPKIKASFDRALSQTEKLSEARLINSPRDPDAMFASVMRLGLRADYTALVEKRNFQALGEIKEARQNAQALLAQSPGYYDAYLALGVENYLLSQKPAPVRWLLHMGGAQTDKDLGITNLRITAAKGRYLQPYAELLLAVAALRDKNKEEARRLLCDLANRFPRNALYREELKKIT
jgi:hypothetical protein